MSEHKHTDECLAYAAETGKAFCIASCRDSRHAQNEKIKKLNHKLKRYENTIVAIYDALDIIVGET